MPEQLTTQAARDDVVRRNGRALAYLAVALGLVALASSVDRWSAQVWYYALEVPGAPPTWGAIMFFAGLLLAYGVLRHSRRVYHLGCQIACLWCSVVCSIQLYAFLAEIHWSTMQVPSLWLLCFQPAAAAWVVFTTYRVLHNSDGTANPMGIAVWYYIAYMYGLRFNLSGKWAYECPAA